MLSFLKKKELKLSVVIVFFNMRREAKRSLYSLTVDYQKNVQESDYEVIVVDSNSTEPLDGKWAESLQSNFRYEYVKTIHPSPCQALNAGIQMAKSTHIVCMIDGARILSPGILFRMMQVNTLFKNPLTQTIAMHLGNEMQMISVEKGYNQSTEDELLKEVDWQENGYKLFNISCLAGSSGRGFLFPLPESNCFCVAKEKLLEIGGFNESFTSPGGGLVNHDTLKRLLQNPEIEPVMLLGEATFHQFHGGVATNVPLPLHPLKIYRREYRDIRGEEFAPENRQSFYFGDLPGRSREFVYQR